MKRIILVALAALFFACGALTAFDTKPDPLLPDGKVIQDPLPASEHMRNVGGSDGAGLCVYTSVTLSAKWHNLSEMYGLRKFAEGRPGGSYPEKLASDIKTYAARNNVKAPDYVQHTGGDDGFLDLVLQTRRYPGITYAGRDDFYDSTIAHMVNMVHLDANYGTIQDNNRPGKWTTDTRQKMLNRWKGLDDNGKPLIVRPYGPVGGGWAFVWLAPPAPPIPPKASEQISKFTNREFCGTWERIVLHDSFSTDLPFPQGEEQIVWIYWSNGEALGGYHKGKFYQVNFDADGNANSLGEEQAMPDGLGCPHEPTAPWNKGIDASRLGTVWRYWINDTECSQAKAYAFVSDPGDGGLIDDSDKYHFSVVGADKKAVAALFADGGPFAKYARRVHVQVYTAADWPAKTVLTSVITLQEPAKRGGKIVGSATSWSVDEAQKVLSLFDPPPPKPEPKPDDPKPSPTPVPVPPAPIKDNSLAWFALAALVLIHSRKGK